VSEGDFSAVMIAALMLASPEVRVLKFSASARFVRAVVRGENISLRRSAITDVVRRGFVPVRPRRARVDLVEDEDAW
jgi:hypothetical protein